MGKNNEFEDQSEFQKCLFNNPLQTEQIVPEHMGILITLSYVFIKVLLMGILIT